MHNYPLAFHTFGEEAVLGLTFQNIIMKLKVLLTFIRISIKATEMYLLLYTVININRTH